jgi:hypothetical protein
MPAVERKGPNSPHFQSIIFSKENAWTKASSRKWLERNKHFTDGFHETETSFRWRQYDPEKDKFNYRTKEFNDSHPISAVLALPKDQKSKASLHTLFGGVSQVQNNSVMGSEATQGEKHDS